MRGFRKDETGASAYDPPRTRTVEPVFANIRHTKRMNRFTLRGTDKVATQWHLYCLVHNSEKIAGSETARR